MGSGVRPTLIAMADTPLPVNVADRSIKTAADLDARLALAQQYRPPGWDASLSLLRRQYEGKILDQVLNAASQRFPATASKMPAVAFPWAKTTATKLATIYDETPTRSLLDAQRTPITEGDVVDEWNDALKEARVSVVMPEADRVCALAESVVLCIRSDTLAAMATGKPAPTVIDHLWPNDVFVIPHPQAPTLLQAALEVFVRTSGAPHCSTYVHWMHDVMFDDDGETKAFGAWRSEIITVERKQKGGLLGRTTTETTIRVRPQWSPYPLPHLPIVVLSRGVPQGQPFMDANRDLPSVFNLLNTGLMSEAYTVDMATVPILWHRVKTTQPRAVPMGPGIKVNLVEGEELGSITQSADLAGMRATNTAMADNLATNMQQPTGAFTGDEKAETGVALKVKNLPAERARRRQQEITRPVEETELWPIFVEVHDHFRGTSIAAAAVGGFQVVFQDPPDFETPAEKQQRLGDAEDRGWISKARAATEAAYYQTVADAKAEQEQIAEERQARMGPGLVAGQQPPRKPGDQPPDDEDNPDDDDDDGDDADLEKKPGKGPPPPPPRG